MNAPRGPEDQASARRATFARTMRAVAWSFFGVRKRADYERDAQGLNPVHVLLGGLLAAALFVAALILTVKWVLASGVAA